MYKDIPKAIAYSPITNTTLQTAINADKVYVEDIGHFPDLLAGEIGTITFCGKVNLVSFDPADFETGTYAGKGSDGDGNFLSGVVKGVEGEAKLWSANTYVSCYNSAYAWNVMRDTIMGLENLIDGMDTLLNGYIETNDLSISDLETDVYGLQIDLTALENSLATVATSGSYNDLSNKPTSFEPGPHNHSASEITSGIILRARGVAPNSTSEGLLQHYGNSGGTARLYSGNTIPTATADTLNYGGRFRSSQLFEGDKRVFLSEGGTLTGNLTLNSNQIIRPRITGASEHAITTTGGNITANVNESNVFKHTMNANCTVTLSNPGTSGVSYSVTLFIKMHTSARTLAFNPGASIRWLNGLTPYAPEPGKVGIYTFVTINNGARWYGSQIANNVDE